MSLCIGLKPQEKLFINGAVISNSGRRCLLNIVEGAQVLREKEILPASEANTVGKQIYLALQMSYLVPEEAERYSSTLEDKFLSLMAASPGVEPLIAEIRQAISSGTFYKGMRIARKLMQSELEVMTHGQ